MQAVTENVIMDGQRITLEEEEGGRGDRKGLRR